nr:hypothetical protein [uncultured Clostridium sp.]
METWKKIRKKYNSIEMIGIFGILICLCIGIFLDWNVIIKYNILIHVGDISSFSLTILQIQATIATLTVAIIALITGSISDSHMGVSVSDFYLNIKPWILKQKILIFLSLGLCLAGTIFYLYGLYNIVFYMFIATLITVSISIIEIYSAFKGKNVEDEEIEAYIDYLLESKEDFQIKVNIYQNFVSDWKRVVNSQERQSYEKYFALFKKCMLKILYYETDEGLVVIKKQCYSMAYCLLNSERTTMKENGIKFIEGVYEVLWGVVLDNKTSNDSIRNRYRNGFFFYTEISEELIQSFQELSAENVEKNLRFENLSDLILRVEIWLMYYENDTVKKANRDNNYINEVDQLCFLARSIGYYLGKQRSKGNITNPQKWTSILNRWSILGSFNVPEERCNDFLEAKLRVYFNYCYGMLLCGHEDIVRQGLYLTGMNNAVKLDNRYHELLYLMVHCYVYYLSEREDDDCVSEAVRKSAKSLLNDGAVKASFENFLNMLAENEEWLDVDIPKQMYEILNRYELFPQFGSSKTMIMENVISDFYLFLILYMSHEYYMPELLEKNIDDMDTFRYVSSGNEKETKALFVSLFRLIFSGNKTDEQIDIEVGLMYDSLEKIVKKKQKERYIELAKEEQKTYETSINEQEICERIEHDALEKIKDKFSDILVDNDEKNGIIRVDLLTLDDYTKSLSKKILDGYYSHMDGMFLFGIEKFLYRRKNLEIKNRFNDFSNDKEFMNYLESNMLKILLGSQFILKNRDFRATSEYNEFLNDYDTIYTSVVREAIALKKDAIKVCLHSVNVSIHSPNINESRAEFDKKTGKYKYSILNGLPIDFDAEELSEFLYNNRKMINVTAKISIQVNEKIVGALLTGRKGL